MNPACPVGIPSLFYHGTIYKPVQRLHTSVTIYSLYTYIGLLFPLEYISPCRMGTLIFFFILVFLPHGQVPGTNSIK